MIKLEKSSQKSFFFRVFLKAKKIESQNAQFYTSLWIMKRLFKKGKMKRFCIY